MVLSLFSREWIICILNHFRQGSEHESRGLVTPYYYERPWQPFACAWSSSSCVLCICHHNATLSLKEAVICAVVWFSNGFVLVWSTSEGAFCRDKNTQWRQGLQNPWLSTAQDQSSALPVVSWFTLNNINNLRTWLLLIYNYLAKSRYNISKL